MSSNRYLPIRLSKQLKRLIDEAAERNSMPKAHCVELALKNTLEQGGLSAESNRLAELLNHNDSLQLQFKISSEVIDRIDQEAEKMNVNRSLWIRLALADYLGSRGG